MDSGISSPFDALSEDLWFLVPTHSPGSPDTMEYLTPSQTPVDTDSGSNADSTEDLLEYQHMLYPEGVDVTDSPIQSQSSEHLLDDCMWGQCESRSSEKIAAPASCTAPSTPSPSHGMASQSSDEQDVSMTKEECVEPAAVFPGLKTEIQCGVSGIRPLPVQHSLKGGISTSESEEEIDIVTVEREKSRRRSSQSALVSRHSSPVRSQGRRKRKRMVRISSQSSRRASHNDLERKRRKKLKNGLDMLRQGIPELEKKDRASIVIILCRACEYIKCIQERDQKLKEEIMREQARQKRLLENWHNCETYKQFR